MANPIRLLEVRSAGPAAWRTFCEQLLGSDVAKCAQVDDQDPPLTEGDL